VRIGRHGGNVVDDDGLEHGDFVHEILQYFEFIIPRRGLVVVVLSLASFWPVCSCGGLNFYISLGVGVISDIIRPESTMNRRLVVNDFGRCGRRGCIRCFFRF
jgi:hypothetical protein